MFTDELLERTTSEWERFGKDTGRKDKYIAPDKSTTTEKSTGGKLNPRKETVDPYSSRIADYWLAVESKDYKSLVKTYAKDKGKLDGTINIAWSAAFISYCMQMAGAGASFPYSPGHYRWIYNSIKNRKTNKLSASLVGYRPAELPLKPGDLLGKSRIPGVAYDNVLDVGWFESHSDVVVEVDAGESKAFVIGGNVGQSVSKVEVKLTPEGLVANPAEWLVHIRNNIQ
ncbi:DUF2272 domain-containing protein [Pseudomonas sp. BGr12]|uniref:DUF2272 domain-containing protein n=1 Tax=Pseudomonas nitroreducens TaxID=46680 RepID=A0A5R9A421_PSENT|nr:MULTISPECIES: DUF2272 domain-containing protein [Pseudomonas]MBD9578788.1 DUF2272 domain-containing protein [Pseudomonas sp. PDM23]MBD9674112.1 DUF2272 domain-containing protein [Pseudomonas sp. PDM21]MDL2429983.1 DUF2272 domain-containing protein [Pseudomonas sp. BJa5]TLP73423.1 DUF2272 domain-containing protein [Pseudomonas nitroreducens]